MKTTALNQTTTHGAAPRVINRTFARGSAGHWSWLRLVSQMHGGAA